MAAITPTDGEKVKTADDVLRDTLFIGPFDTKPTLLYFHTPHEDIDKSDLKGAALVTMRQCRALQGEQTSRWLSLYRCVEIDMAKSDLKTAERLGWKEGVIVSIVDKDLKVLGSTKPLAESEAVVAFLKGTMKSAPCGRFWGIVQTRIDEQKKRLDEARALAEKKKTEEALDAYREVLASDVRVADFYGDAEKEFAKLARKAEQAK
jgi:hypothetical protein